MRLMELKEQFKIDFESCMQIDVMDSSLDAFGYVSTYYYTQMNRVLDV